MAIMGDATRESRSRSKHGLYLKLFIGALVIALAFGAARHFGLTDLLQDLLKQLLVWIDGLGAAGAVVFVVIYTVSCILFVPGSILTVGAGVLFGVIQGSLLVSIASVAGATGAFLIGRYLARGWVARRIEGKPKFKAIDAAVAREGWKIVGLTRLSPIFPFNLLNYAYGLTQVSLRDYVLASWIGMMPGTVLYVYIGSLAGDLATLGTAERSRTPGEWALLAAGLAATVAVTIYVTRIARRALAKKVDENVDGKERQ